jgi:UDP-N-acetylmuramoyl-L-alanyl-D-glutamate--2,6-diaminopimelate ligase
MHRLVLPGSVPARSILRKMVLAELLPYTDVVQIEGDPRVDIRSLAYDSRRVQQAGLFFAIPGERADGHSFIDEASRRGMVAVASERPAPERFPGTWVQVAYIRRALAGCSRAFYRYPDEKLKLVGITGTNGKTTTAYLLHSILEAAGVATALFGTVEYRTGIRSVPAHHTTPESLDLIEYLDEVFRCGGKAAVMEVSSHALAQERVWGFRFAAAVFTNLTRDHLDYHKTFESYFAAKRKLFEGVGAPPPELGVINLDDGWGERILKIPQPRQVTYGMNSKAQVRVKHCLQDELGIRATLLTPGGKVEVESALLGRANLANILAAVAAAVGLGVETSKIEAGLRLLRQVPGRLERVDEGQPFTVLVDYAHTDDALRNVLTTVRDFTRNKLIVVFGCGGERDRTKRPLMGEVAGRLSDWAILTSDNPRGEDPFLIMNDVMVGLQKSGGAYVAQVDRERAIQTALEQARDGDTVLLAGKGHETYQVLKDRPIDFDDRRVARKILKEMGFGRNVS